MKFALDEQQRDFAASVDAALSAADVPAAVRAWGQGDTAPGRKIWSTLADSSASPRSRCRRSSTVSRRTRRIWWSRSSGWAGGAFPVRSPNRLRWRPSCSAAETNGPNGRRHWRPVSWSPRWHCRPQSPRRGRRLRRVDAAGPGRLAAEATAAGTRTSRSTRREGCSTSTPPAPPNPPTWPGHSSSGCWRRPRSWSGGQAMLDMSVEYAKQRSQFGRIIGSYQAIKHKLADVHIAVELARPLVYGRRSRWPTPCRTPHGCQRRQGGGVGCRAAGGPLVAADARCHRIHLRA